MSLDPVVEEMCLSGYGDIIEILLLIVKSYIGEESAKSTYSLHLKHLCIP